MEAAILKSLYAPSAKEFSRVDVPAMNFLMVDGEGDPNNSESFKQAVQALYSLSYTLKFAARAQKGVNFRVSPLEGLWWSDDWDAIRLDERASWRWTLMIMQPEAVDEKMFTEALAAVRQKKGASPALGVVRFERFEEGPSVQIMHIGPYSAEGPVIARLHEQYLPEHGLTPAGKHHEIYIGDPNRAAPEKLKTILRQPVRAA